MQGGRFQIIGLLVNLAPADIRKEGSAFDLPIAIGIIAAMSRSISPEKLSQYAILGELALDGTVRPARGVLSIAIEAKKAGLNGLMMPVGNAREAAIAGGLDVLPVRDLTEALDFLEGYCDIHVEAPAVQYEDLANEPMGESSEEIRGRVQAARHVQLHRFRDHPHLYSNAHMGPREISAFCKIDGQCEELLRMAITRLELSARAYDRILKANRTIADLEGKVDIQSRPVAEAIQYRSLDRKLWE